MGSLYTTVYNSVINNNVLDNDHDVVVYFDLETSGFSRKSDILQIAALCNGSLFSVYIDPIQYISPRASKVTGLTNINGELRLNDVPVPTIPLRLALRQFLNFLIELNRPVVLLAHNCNFDSSILINSIKIMSMVEDFGLVVSGFADSLSLIKTKTKRNGKGELTLSGLASWLNISADGAHNAESDVTMLANIIESLNITTNEITCSKTTWNDSISAFEQMEYKNIVLTTLSPLGNCVSKGMKEKLAKAGIAYEDLINAYVRGGDTGISQLLGVDENGVVRVTKSKKVINGLLDYLKKPENMRG